MSEQRDFRDEQGRPAREFTITIPDREPDDTDPATPNQLRFLRKLADWEDPSVLQNLGKWQASAMIDQVKDAKHSFQDEVEAGETLPTQHGASSSLSSWIVVALIVALIAIALFTEV